VAMITETVVIRIEEGVAGDLGMLSTTGILRAAVDAVMIDFLLEIASVTGVTILDQGGSPGSRVEMLVMVDSQSQADSG
jgi:hypothetical protein